MTKITLEVLHIEMKNFAREMRNGFEETNGHLKTLNGQVKTHSTLINNLEKQDITMAAELEATKEKGKSTKLPHYFITTLIAVVLLLLGRYVY